MAQAKGVIRIDITGRQNRLNIDLETPFCITPVHSFKSIPGFADGVVRIVSGDWATLRELEELIKSLGGTAEQNGFD